MSTISVATLMTEFNFNYNFDGLMSVLKLRRLLLISTTVIRANMSIIHNPM